MFLGISTDIWYPILLFFIGILVGGINAVAGGGSLLTLPTLIFMGLDSNIANGTNRLAILFQTMSSIAGYESKGISTKKYGLWLGIATTLGAIPGVILAVNISDALFNKILAIIMLVMMITLIYNPFKNARTGDAQTSKKQLAISFFIFLFIGAYIGFIQAGAGFLIIMTLVVVNQFNLVITNSIKVWVTFCANAMVLAVFAWKGMVYWPYAIALSFGTSLGAWLTSRWAVSKGDSFIRPVLIVMIFIMSMKLLGVFDWLKELLF